MPGERGKRKWKIESVVKREKEGRERKEVAEGQVMQHFTSRTFYLSESGMVKTCGSHVNGEKEKDKKKGLGVNRPMRRFGGFSFDTKTIRIR